MAEEDQQNKESGSDGGDGKATRQRLWTNLAIIAVTIFIVLGALMILFLLRDRSEPEEAPTATVTPTATAEPIDALWQEIQEQGTIVVGTSADYPPFEFYDRDFQLDGLDIAIINEVARRLGLSVELRDMVFDGLSNALQVNQIDAAISAITITDQRRQFVDFSNTYYVSADALLADENAPFDDISDPNALSGLRLGVERGTLYESWANTELVEAGLMSADDVFAYDRMDDAISDLRAGRIDIIALDLHPAQSAADEGGLKVVAQGLNENNFGIAVPKGAFKFLAQINQALRTMEDDGTIRKLSAEYTGLTEDAIQPLPEEEPTPGTSGTPAPGGCVDSSELVQHLSYDDQNLTDFPELTPGEPFQKGWKLRNSGTCTWTTGYALAVSGGDSMGGILTLVQTPVEPGEEYDFWVDLVAPVVPGDYVGYWSMRNDQSGLLFGDRVSVAVEVIAAPEPTPLPTQTPAPGVSFTASPETIQQGQCSTLTWSTQNVDAVFLYEQGEDWSGNQVADDGSRTVCPLTTRTYELRVVLSDGSAVVRTLTVTVVPNSAVPQISRFTVDPPDQVLSGQCVTIRWTVEGSVSTVTIGRGGVVIWPNAPFGGSMQDCPPLGQQSYTIEATGPGGTSQAAWTINVVSQASGVPTSTPTVAPGTPTPGFQPVIYYFQAQPTTIPRNTCVTLSWSVGGNATRLRMVRNGVTVQENLPFHSSWNDCNNSNVGTVIYILVAQSNFNETATGQVVLTVTP